MRKLKPNWGLVIYWFVVMSIMNAYIIPKFVEDEPITGKRIIVALIVSLISGLIMGTIVKPKPKPDNE